MPASIRRIYGQYNERLSTPNTRWVLLAGEVNYFEVEEWKNPDFETPKVITWKIKDATQRTTFETLQSTTLEKISLSISKKYSGSYGYYLEAVLSTGETANAFISGSCEKKIAKSGWSKKPKEEDQSEVNYGHKIFLTMETEGCNGDRLLIEVYHSKDKNGNTALETVSAECINGNISAVINTISYKTNLKEPGKKEEFYIKVKSPDGTYATTGKAKVSILDFDIANKDVIPEPELNQDIAPIVIGKPDKTEFGKIVMIPDAVVHFRPRNNWKGTGYGFDWFRVEDTRTILGSSLFGDDDYEDIVGRYNEYPSSHPTARFSPDATMVENLKAEYGTNYIIPWKLKRDKPVQYHPSWLSMYVNDTIHLSLGVMIRDINVLPTSLVLAYEKDFFTITSSLGTGAANATAEKTVDPRMHYTQIPIRNQAFYGLVDEIAITCLRKITGREKTIRAIVNGKEAGFLKVFPNQKKKLNVVFVKVTANFENGVDSIGSLKGQDGLRLILNQSLIDATIVEKDLDITKNGATLNTDLQVNTLMSGNKIKFNGTLMYNGARMDLVNYLDAKLKAKYPLVNYDNYLRIYFVGNAAIADIGDEDPLGIGGRGYIGDDKSGNGNAIMYLDVKDIDISHEGLHAMGIEHAFGAVGAPANRAHAPYMYKYQATENIMDYAANNREKYSTWQWQWKFIRQHRYLTDQD